MKKIILLIGLFVVCLCSCSKDDNNGVDEGEEFAYELLLNKHSETVINKIYSIVMRLDIPYPFPHYVMRLADGNNCYFRKSKIDYELQAGDVLDYYWTYKLADAEIYELATDRGSMKQDDIDENDKQLAKSVETRGLIFSDEKTGKIADMFKMSVRFSIPFVPLECLFIELEDGSLIYMKSFKNDQFQIGDEIAYTTYVLYPNEVVAAKKKTGGEEENPPLVDDEDNKDPLNPPLVGDGSDNDGENENKPLV